MKHAEDIRPAAATTARWWTARLKEANLPSEITRRWSINTFEREIARELSEILDNPVYEEEDIGPIIENFGNDIHALLIRAARRAHFELRGGFLPGDSRTQTYLNRVEVRANGVEHVIRVRRG